MKPETSGRGVYWICRGQIGHSWAATDRFLERAEGRLGGSWIVGVAHVGVQPFERAAEKLLATDQVELTPVRSPGCGELPSFVAWSGCVGLCAVGGSVLVFLVGDR